MEVDFEKKQLMKMKKELTLREVQDASLKILQDIHSFCLEHSIIYSVAYGTLIGTIRHKGFIPWDDDIDIIMPRPEYERFCREYKSAQYKLKCCENDSDCMIAFARVYDNLLTIMDSVVPWCKSEVGVWIDVFPIDCVSDIEPVFRDKHDELKLLWEKSITARTAIGRIRADRSFLFNVKLIAKKMLYGKGREAKKLIRQVILKAKDIPWGESLHWSQLCCLDGYEYHYLEDFSSVVSMPFEYTEVMVMNGYDRVLRECFGDYMELPPIEKRVGHFDGLTKFYWKE